MIERFGDPERGGFFSTSSDHEELIARRKEIGDHPIPSGNSAAALGLLRLAALTGERELRAPGRGRPAPLRAAGRRATPTPSPTCCGRSTSSSRRPRRWRWSPRGRACEVAELAAVVRAGLRPHLVLAGGPEGTDAPPLLEGRTTVDGRAAAYVCESFACQAPVTDATEPGRTALISIGAR